MQLTSLSRAGGPYCQLEGAKRNSKCALVYFKQTFEKKNIVVVTKINQTYFSCFSAVYNVYININIDINNQYIISEYLNRKTLHSSNSEQ